MFRKIQMASKNRLHSNIYKSEELASNMKYILKKYVLVVIY